MRLIFNSVISKYVMSNCWKCNQCLDCVIIQCCFSVFKSTNTGVELLDNRMGCLSPPSVGERVGPLGAGANTHQLGCFIIAAFYHHCCLDFLLINYHKHIHFSPCCASHELLRKPPSAVRSLNSSGKSVNSQHNNTDLECAEILKPAPKLS